MARAVKAWWDERSKRYFCRLGDVSETTGRRGNYMLRDEDGRPIAYGDVKGRDAAILRRQAELDRLERLRRGDSVAEVCRAFVAWHRETGSAPRTIRDHVDHLNAWCAFSHEGVCYGDRPAASIDVDDLARMRKSMEAAGNQTGYIKIRYASILACWRWAARPIEGREPLRLLKSNPFEGLARPRRGRGRNKALPWPVTRKALRLAWGFAKRRPYHRPGDRDQERLRVVYARYCALTGCRPDEAARLKWSELDLSRRVAVQHGKTTSRTGKLRRVPLTVSLAKALKRLERWPGRHPEYVFVPAASRKVKPPNSREFGIWFRGLRDRLRAGPMPEFPETATLYWTRHEFQSFGLEVVSVEGVAAAAGNSPGVLLSTYAHIEDRRVVEVGDAIDKHRRRVKDRGVS